MFAHNTLYDIVLCVERYLRIYDANTNQLIPRQLLSKKIEKKESKSFVNKILL
jgi:hypothetical protein